MLHVSGASYIRAHNHTRARTLNSPHRFVKLKKDFLKANNFLHFNEQCAPRMSVRKASLLWALAILPACAANKTATWLTKRDQLIASVYGRGAGVLPSQSVPDQTITYPSDPGLQGLVWNISNGLFPITSTVFYAPVSKTADVRSKTAFLFHHGVFETPTAPFHPPSPSPLGMAPVPVMPQPSTAVKSRLC